MHVFTRTGPSRRDLGKEAEWVYHEVQAQYSEVFTFAGNTGEILGLLLKEFLILYNLMFVLLKMNPHGLI